MNVKTLALLLTLGSSPVMQAQEGYPMDGTWRGEWGPNEDGDKTMVVMVLTWNGSEIEGILNPGRNAVPFESAVLDPNSWTLRLSATQKDGTSITVEGKLENIGAYNRSVTGIWKMNGNEFPFLMARE